MTYRAFGGAHGSYTPLSASILSRPTPQGWSCCRGPKDHINIRISDSGSKAEIIRGIPEIMVSRILMFIFYYTILYCTILYNRLHCNIPYYTIYHTRILMFMWSVVFWGPMLAVPRALCWRAQASTRRPKKPESWKRESA